MPEAWAVWPQQPEVSTCSSESLPASLENPLQHLTITADKSFLQQFSDAGLYQTRLALRKRGGGVYCIEEEGGDGGYQYTDMI